MSLEQGSALLIEPFNPFLEFFGACHRETTRVLGDPLYSAASSITIEAGRAARAGGCQKNRSAALWPCCLTV